MLQFLRIYQNPHFIYTISRINSVSIYRLRSSLILEIMICSNLDSGLFEQVEGPAIKR